MRRLFYLTILELSFAVLLSPSFAHTPAQKISSPEISFTVSMSKPATHLLEVEMRVRQSNAATVSDLVMPVWTPGSYMIREFERNVQDFSADANGRPLGWTKINKNTWRVTTNGAGEWRARYRVYANELTVRTNELNSDHAFWNNAALLMYLDGFIESPSTLHIVPADGWKVATGLPPVTGQANAFRAENFDILYDSPVEVSNFKQIDFAVRGVPHRIVIDGEGNYDLARLRDGAQKIVEAEVAMFNDIPYHDYTFILHLRSNIGGGIEHLNSTSLGFRRTGFANANGYRNFWGLVAHEFFHLWNVKRIRPDALGPFDYTKENYTRLLWVAEGITEYYGNLMVRRAGLMTETQFVDHVAAQIQDVQQTPGRLEMSAEEASFDSWIKEYRPDENSVNSSISYYDKGELLGLLLDLEIRRNTHGAKSLDDVMRALYTDFYKKGRNYSPSDFQKICESVAGENLNEFFAKYVRGRLDLAPEYNQRLSVVGLQLETAAATRDGAAPKAYLGADLNQAGDRLVITAVRSGSPAYDQGLNANDQIVALDGARVNREGFEARLAEKKPGDIIRITIFRADDLRNLEVTLGGRSEGSYRITSLPAVTEEQKQIYNSWIGNAQNR
jgi:predicted metalloprotease with PDZ domain